MSELISTVTGISYDGLIGGTSITPMTKNVTLKAVTASYKKGTILALVTGKYELVTAVTDANAILADDVVAAGADMVITVYTKGLFNRGALTVGAEDTVNAHEEQLRAVGIYLTSEQ